MEGTFPCVSFSEAISDRKFTQRTVIKGHRSKDHSNLHDMSVLHPQGRENYHNGVHAFRLHFLGTRLWSPGF